MSREQALASLRERILAFAASRIGSDAAEDLAQEVLMVIEEKYANVEDLADLLPLSLKILRFKIMASRRKSERRGEHRALDWDEVYAVDGSADPEANLLREENRQRLVEAVRQLGERCRAIFRLRLLGKGAAEIQEELGAASINTVYTWEARCRRRLLALMGGRWGSGK